MRDRWSSESNLHESNAFLGLLVEQGNALLEALLVGLPGLQQLSLPGAVSILDGSRNIHVLHAQSQDQSLPASQIVAFELCM